MKLIILFTFFFTLNTFASTLSIATQNLWHYPIRLKKRIKIAKNSFADKADIIAFQEAFYWGKKKKSIINSYLQSRNYQKAWLETHHNRFIKQGLATLSVFDLAKDNISFHQLPWSTKTRPRFALQTNIKIHHKVFAIFNVHLSPFPKNAYKRKDQMKALKQLIAIERKKGNVIIVLGDFNEDISSRNIDFFKISTKLDYVPIHHHCTFCKKNKYVVSFKNYTFDYIFYDKNQLEVLNSSIINKENPISDHYGVKANFSIR